MCFCHLFFKINYCFILIDNTIKPGLKTYFI